MKSIFNLFLNIVPVLYPLKVSETFAFLVFSGGMIWGHRSETSSVHILITFFSIQTRKPIVWLVQI